MTPDTGGTGDIAKVHTPVLLNEVLEFLKPGPGMRILDGTLGLGGHTEAMLEKAGGDLEVLGLDRDISAMDLAGKRLRRFGENVRYCNTAFSGFKWALDENGWDELDGVLLDLGVSSLQIDTPERGFSFREDGPLDMRMDKACGLASAKTLVNKESFSNLRYIIRTLGEEPQANAIAKAIVREREKQEILSTKQLAGIVEMAYPAKWRRTARMHPATRTFQALRMAVNRELDELKSFLDDIVDYVRPGGVICVISFHSLEDRVVKRAFKSEATGCVCPPRQPYCTCGHKAKLEILTKKPVMASELEVEANPRSRSAKLRAARRLETEEAR